MDENVKDLENNPEGDETPEIDLDIELEGEDKGESPSTGKEPEYPAFYDTSKVPTGLQPTFKEMQAAFTRKTQELSKERSNLMVKAEFAEKILSDPVALQALAQLEVDAQPEQDGPEADEVSKRVREAMSPVVQKLNQLEKAKQELDIQRERDMFVSKYPNWELMVGRDGMAAALDANPTLTLEDAYLRAVGAKYITASASRKKAPPKTTVESRGTAPPVQEGGLHEPGSLWEAARAAAKELGYRLQ